MNGPAILDRLIEVLLPQGGYVFVLYEAYLDESYSDDPQTPVMVVGGYIVASDQASLMDAEWREVLARYKVPYFHMKDVAPCKGTCSHLKDECCDAMAREMIGIIGKYVHSGCAQISNKAARTTRQRDKLVSFLQADPYCASVEFFVRHSNFSLNLQDKEPPTFAFFLEEGHPSVAEAALEAKRRSKQKGSLIYGADIQGLTILPKENHPILQAADILVWQIRKYLVDKLNKRRGPRGDFLELMKKKTLLNFEYLQLRHAHSFYAESPVIDFVELDCGTGDLKEHVAAMFSKPISFSYSLDFPWKPFFWRPFQW